MIFAMSKPDTRGLSEYHLGRPLRLHLRTGEAEDVVALELTVCDPPEPCCGLTYRLIRASQPKAAKVEGSVYWTGFSNIEEFRVIGDSAA
jgi:hypothetical protein